MSWWALSAVGVVAVVVIHGGVGLRKRSGGKRAKTMRKTTTKKKTKTKTKKK